ncbi:MAG: PIG-L family deacetylase, partial [Candidatus Mariimomonas ferrooxydans]
REKDSEEALSILGVGDYEFLRFPDREIKAYYNEVFERLLKIMQDYIPDTVYSPSMVELNPDHRATSALALKLLDTFKIRVAFYEVTSPLRPNILVDTTYVHKCKETAVKKYSSQLRLINYIRHIDALNTVRTLTVQGPRYIEAFWLVNRPLTDDEIKEWLSYKLPVNFR